MKIMKMFGMLVVLLGLSLTAQAKLHLPAQMADNMVLQQETKANVYGWADAGTLVTVTTSWNQQRYTATADKQGAWLVQVDTPKGGFQEQQLTITNAGETVSLNHVLIGEVWMGSGQSNMEMPMRGFNNCAIEGYAEQLIHSVDWTGKIRMATIPRTETFEPMEENGGEWKECNPANMPAFSATAYYFAQNICKVLNVPVGIIANAWGGSRVEGWLPKAILDEYGIASDKETVKANLHTSMHYPVVMHNGQFWPVRNYTIKGVIWYQGCTNAEANFEGTKYAERMHRLVQYWREVKNQPNLPVYQVQLAQFIADGAMDGDNFVVLRDQQLKCAEMDPQIYLASLLDVYVPHELNQIHPRNKAVVGLRLASLALGNTYQQEGFAKETLKYFGMEVKDNKIKVKFTNWQHVGGWGQIGDIKGVEICGADHQWVPADVQVDGYSPNMLVSSPQVPNPVAVRYGWHNFMECTLTGANGMGAYPFNSENDK